MVKGWFKGIFLLVGFILVMCLLFSLQKCWELSQEAAPCSRDWGLGCGLPQRRGRTFGACVAAGARAGLMVLGTDARAQAGVLWPLLAGWGSGRAQHLVPSVRGSDVDLAQGGM